MIGAATVRQGVMPEDEVPGFAGNRSYRIGRNLRVRIDIVRKIAQPFVDPAMKAGNAGKRALVRRRVGKVHDALDTKRDRRFQECVPMQVRSRKPE